MTLHARSFVRANFILETPWQSVVLEAAERHLRRKLIVLPRDEEVLVDFEKPVKLEHGDCLVLDNGKLVQIVAGEEELTQVKGRDPNHLSVLAWHIGNRHLEAQIEIDRILIRRDHVIAHMLEHLGAKITDVRETFSPEHGAYHSHDVGDGHEH
jgi:urease accessory protein